MPWSEPLLFWLCPDVAVEAHEIFTPRRALGCQDFLLGVDHGILASLCSGTEDSHTGPRLDYSLGSRTHSTWEHYVEVHTLI